jgi:hypothetical protein
VTHEFVSAEFVVPRTFEGPGFRMESLGSQHNERDHVAWMSSIDHIKAIPAFAASSWPEAMSLEQNLSDLEGHAWDFENREGFTYSILDGDDVIGCLYIYPSPEQGTDASVTWWVTQSRAEMTTVVGPALNSWLEADWPFENWSGM